MSEDGIAPRRPDPVSSRRRSVGFLVRFVVLLLVFYLIVASRPVNDAVIVPFTAGIASVSAKLLNALGEHAEVAGTEIRSSSFGVNIENGCNGVETALLFGAAVLAFPASWPRRLLGLLAGFIAIQILNLVRVITLFWIGLHRPALFNSSHTVIWQSVVVLFGVLLFLFWASRERRLSAESSPAGDAPRRS
ncbi:MAG TPA: exosortase H [Thermoanaerobaculia bacterium]|nr:exosortase H [Thermoanaerobaculia bacterium]